MLHNKIPFVFLDPKAQFLHMAVQPALVNFYSIMEERTNLVAKPNVTLSVWAHFDFEHERGLPANVE